LRHPDAVRLLWRIVLRDRGPNAFQNQGHGRVAVPLASWRHPHACREIELWVA
jgi:hypothetical protein